MQEYCDRQVKNILDYGGFETMEEELHSSHARKEGFDIAWKASR